MTGFSPTSPVVSVLMAVHDGEPTVRRALESLQAQTFTNFEVVAVDAGSTDGTARILDTMSERDMRISVTHVEDKSVFSALDLALSRLREEAKTLQSGAAARCKTYLTLGICTGLAVAVILI